MIGNAPDCYKCRYRNRQMISEGKLHCKKFPSGIPQNIFFENVECKFYVSRSRGK